MTNVSDVNGNTVVEYTYDSEGRWVEVTDAQGTRDVVVDPTTGGLDSPFLIVKENDVEAAFAYAGDMPLARVDKAGNPVYYLDVFLSGLMGNYQTENYVTKSKFTPTFRISVFTSFRELRYGMVLACKLF